MKNNKGFSLLELIISFAILSIISAVLLGFISTGTNTFHSISSEVGLQYESQLALAQLQEYLIDCNGGVCFDNYSKELYLLNTSTESGNAVYTLHTFKLDGDNIYYDTQLVTVGVDGTLNYYTSDSTSYQPDLMASHVSSFDISFDATYVIDANSYATKANIIVSFSNSGKTFTGNQDIALRNVVITSGTFSALALSVIAASTT